MKKNASPPFPHLQVARIRRLLIAAVGSTTLAFSGCDRGGRAAGDTIVVSGNIEVIDAQLAFKIPGRLVERAADEGGTVKGKTRRASRRR